VTASTTSPIALDLFGLTLIRIAQSLLVPQPVYHDSPSVPEHRRADH
jgi:hypothetical protein